MIPFQRAPARLPEGKRVYAVGDVHGCLDRLRALHDLIEADLRDRPVAAPELVHLGDIVDRGPDSAGVVALLAAGPRAGRLPGVTWTCLMGNHEHMMLSALDREDPSEAGLWLENGGVAALRSWGVPDTAPPAEWAGYVPRAHLDFLRGLKLSHRVGPYLFVHAGVNPVIGLDAQRAEDLMWIRQPFLAFEGDLGAVVVHGHTPRRQPEVRPHRISVDTGAVMGGALTCAVLEGEHVGFLQT